MKSWRALPSERSTCVTAEWSTNDWPARVEKSHVSALALGADVFRFWRWRRSDDRVAVDWRGDVDAGATGEAGRGRDDHRFAGRSRRRGNEDRRHRWPVLLDRPCVVS